MESNNQTINNKLDHGTEKVMVTIFDMDFNSDMIEDILICGDLI